MPSRWSHLSSLIRLSSVFFLSLRLITFFSDVPLVAAASATVDSQLAARQVEVFQPESFLALTNADRAQRGIAPLTLNDELNAAALAKAEDMAQKGYWEHFRPGDNKAPWDFIKESGYDYKIAGENLAKGYRTPNGITSAWMASPTHKANLLSAKYTEVGFACIDATINGEEVLLTVQMFGSR